MGQHPAALVHKGDSTEGVGLYPSCGLEGVGELHGDFLPVTVTVTVPVAVTVALAVTIARAVAVTVTVAFSGTVAVAVAQSETVTPTATVTVVVVAGAVTAVVNDVGVPYANGGSILG
jgi:hypothetical protein